MRAALTRLAGPGLVAAAMGAAAAQLILRTGGGAGVEAGARPSAPAVAAAVLAAVAGAAAAARAARRVSASGAGAGESRSPPPPNGAPGPQAARNPMAALTGGGAVCAGMGLWLAAGAGAAQAAGLILAAAGFGPALALQRLLITDSAEALGPGGRPWPARDDEGHELRYALFAWHWAAVAFGGVAVLGLAMLRPVDASVVLRACGAIAAAGGLVTLLRPPRRPAEARDGISIPDSPWARRSAAAALGLGALIAGGAGPGLSLLRGEWQRSPQGAAGVLAAAAAAAAAAVTFGRWFHRLHRRRGAARAGAAGAQLVIAGGAALLGALSFTYVGLIAAWAAAAGAAALAAAGLDAATWSALHPSVRPTAAARQVAAFALGAALAAALAVGPLAGRHDQLKTAAAALPCIAVGVRLARRCPPPSQAGHSARDWDRAVPRRVGQGRADASDAATRRFAPDAGRIASGSGTPLLRLVDVGVAYEGVQVVFGANLTVEEGQIAALLGTNGAGKTTTLRAVSGLEPVCGGRISYRGLDITRTPPTWRVGMGLHQIVGGDAVAGALTVEDNLRLFAHSVSRARAGAGIAAALEVFPRLAERRSQSAATLSGGEKQMLALAKAFIVSPRLLMIDEFSLGLAPALVAELTPVVRRIADQGAAVLLVEQSVDVACGLADYAYVMEKGEIRLRGPTADLQRAGDLVRSVYLADAGNPPQPPTAPQPPEPAEPPQPPTAPQPPEPPGAAEPPGLEGRL